MAELGTDTVDPQSPDPKGAAGTGRRRLVVLGAALAVVVIAAGVVVALTRDSGGAPAVGPGAPRSTVARDPRLPADALANATVRDGDLVRARGSLLAEPGKPLVFCGFTDSGVSSGPAGGQLDPSCPTNMSVAVSGVDLDRLGNVHRYGAKREANVLLTGSWHADRSIAVTSAESFGYDDDFPTQAVSLKPPCPAPAGGWHKARVGNRTKLDAYREQHPDRFGGSTLAEPADSDPNSLDRTEVIVVEAVTGDLAATQAELAPLYSGNLCVVRGRYSLTRQRAAAHGVQALMDHMAALGVWGFGAGPGRVSVHALVVDEQVYQRLAPLDRPAGILLFEDTPIRPLTPR